MSRFVAPNLAALRDIPALVDVDFESVREGRNEFIIEALAQHGIDLNVDQLSTDPVVVSFSEGGGASEVAFRQKVNESIEALSLATAVGGDLDHIGGTYAGIQRLVYEVADDETPPTRSVFDDVTGRWVENDDDFRDRVLLAFEAFSTAGPEGAYVFHTLELDGVRDIADAVVYSEEDDAVYSDTLHQDAYSMGLRSSAFDGRADDDPVLAPEVLIVVLPTVNYGAADAALLKRVYLATTANDVRPIGDNVRVEQATVTDYTISVTIRYRPGADVDAIRSSALTRLQAYADSRRRIGFSVQREVIGGRSAIDDGVTVEITSPATDIIPGSKGAANCTAITVTAIQVEGTWQSP